MHKPGQYIRDLLAGQPGTHVSAHGWIKTRRDSKGLSFLQLSDGSCFRDLQVVVEGSAIDEALLQRATTGACVRVEGELVQSPAAGQAVELKASALEIFGSADAQ